MFVHDCVSVLSVSLVRSAEDLRLSRFCVCVVGYMCRLCCLLVCVQPLCVQEVTCAKCN